MEDKTCKQCGEKFKPRHSGSKYCSKRCLWDSRKGHTPYNKGKGVGWVDKRGYHWDYVTENGRRVARRKHRIIMEIHLRRKLEPWELVHHKDGNQSNNEIPNLEITTWGEHASGHHKGTRRDDQAKKSMEAFALMREELKRERELKSELLEALEEMVNYYSGPRTFANEEIDDMARAAIKKA